MKPIMPCLWFNKNGEEAANFYVSLLPNSKILEITRSPSDWPSGKAGDVITVTFELNGQKYMALNGGPEFKFTEALSLSVECDTQAEIDTLWEKLTANGGQEIQCGWLKDKYGLPWQICSTALTKLINDPDKTKAARAFAAMSEMIKIDIATIERAAEAKAA